MFDMVDDTIVAVSSPPGASARGIVRCSGPDAIGLAQSVFSPEAGVDIRAVPGFRRLAGLVHLERLCDVPGELYLFRGPRSYTRQDCVEFHVPGSSAVLAMLVERLIELGARAAEAGEFTARAFLSGAMDLVQAEAVAQVIRSRSDAQLRAAQRMMDGRLGGQIDGMLEQVAELVALVEADIDFAEEPIEFITPGQLQSRLSDIVGRLGRLIGGADSSERLDVLPQILLIGRPNAGKSTLMNRLSGVDRSICAPLAGTTRDLLLAPIRVGGHEAILLDAAGVDAETDALMVEAGSATTAAMSRVDLLCHVVDISRELDASVPAVDRASPRTPRVVVGNKIDIVDADTIAMRRRRLEDAGLGPVCPVSAKTGAGIDACRRALDDALTLPQSQVAEDVLLLTARQREAIERALAAIERCVAEAAEIDETIDRADILAFELREAMEALGSVCGSVATDDLLGRIFSSFCIGK